MNQLLIFIKEDCIELWSMDSNGRVLPVNYQSSNKIPLYFILDGEKIQMDVFARSQYLEHTSGNFTFGDFWKNIGSKSISYSRFEKNYSFDTLLPFALKESILPSVIKSHFHSPNFSEFISQKRTFFLFDSFVEEDKREVISKGLLEIVGFSPENLFFLDYWEILRQKLNDPQDVILFLNASLGNIYIHLIGNKHPYHISKKVIEGKGRDPRVDTILDFIAEKAKLRGSNLSLSEIKMILVNDAPIVLNLLKNGLVQHTIKNHKLDISQIRLDFHSSEVEGRLNNTSSLNFIQNEFEDFRRYNNAENLSIYLNGDVINQSVFTDFFKSTYSKVFPQNDNFENVFLEEALKSCRSSLNNSNTHSSKFTSSSQAPLQPPSAGVPPRPTPQPSSGVPPRPTPQPSAGVPPRPTPPPSAGVPPRPTPQPSAGVPPRPTPPPSAGVPPRPTPPPPAGVPPRPTPPPSAGVPPRPTPPPAPPPRAGVPPKPPGPPKPPPPPPKK